MHLWVQSIILFNIKKEWWGGETLLNIVDML